MHGEREFTIYTQRQCTRYDPFERVRPSDHPTVASIRVCHDSVPRPIAYAYVNYHKVARALLIGKRGAGMYGSL